MCSDGNDFLLLGKEILGNNQQSVTPTVVYLACKEKHEHRQKHKRVFTVAEQDVRWEVRREGQAGAMLTFKGFESQAKELGFGNREAKPILMFDINSSRDL